MKTRTGRVLLIWDSRHVLRALDAFSRIPTPVHSIYALNALKPRQSAHGLWSLRQDLLPLPIPTPSPTIFYVQSLHDLHQPLRRKLRRKQLLLFLNSSPKLLRQPHLHRPRMQRNRHRLLSRCIPEPEIKRLGHAVDARFGGAVAVPSAKGISRLCCLRGQTL